MRRFALDPLGVALLSLRQLYVGLPAWLQINALGLALSLPLVTLPAAQAGLIYAVREGLLDQIDAERPAHAAFFHGFRRHFVRGTLTLLLDLAIGAIIVYSFFFWALVEIPALNYIAAISVYFGLFWLVCQPFVLPVCVEYPELSPPAALRQTARLVLSRPVYAILTALLLALVNLAGVILLGPVLLILGVLAALIAVQALWVMTERELPAPPGEVRP